MRVGIKIKAIRLFQLLDGPKAKTIQVGADKSVLYFTDWTMNDIMRATRFDLTGKPKRSD